MQDDTHIHSLMLILPPLPLPLRLQLQNFVVGTTCASKPPSSSCRSLCRILVTFSPTLCASFSLSLSSRVPPLASTPLTYSCDSKFASPQPASPWPTPAHTFTLYLDIGHVEAVSTSSPKVTSCGSLWGRRVVMIRIFQGAFLRRERKRKRDRVSSRVS